MVRFPLFGRRSARTPADARSTALAARRRRTSRGRTTRLSSEPLEARAMLAADIVEVISSAANVGYNVGDKIPFQVSYDEPVLLSGTIQARMNTGGLATFKSLTGYAPVAGSGTTLTFEYTVQAGDNVPQLDVALTAPPGFLVGGSITTVSTAVLNDADRLVTNAGTPDFTMTTWNAGMFVDTTSPATPTVSPTVYVNPTVWQGGTWAAFHPDYFVIRGTAGTGSLAADETLTVTVNGATYVATSASVAPNFHVDATGNWLIRIRPVGLAPATAPTSGALDPWSTNDTDSYNVVATLRDAAGNVTTDVTTDELVIDTLAPQVAEVSSDTPAGRYSVGTVLDIYVEYDEPVRVVGVPTLPINIDPNPKVAVYNPTLTAAWAAGNRVYFTYTVVAGDGDNGVTPFDYVGTTINLNGGFIEDLAANPAEIDLPVPSTTAGPVPNSVAADKLIYIDTTAPNVAIPPAVTSPVPNGTYYFGGPLIPITIQFSEPVDVTGTPTLALNSGTLAQATYFSGSGTNTLTFNYVVGTTDDATDLDYDSVTALQLSGGTIVDVAGNPAVLTLPAPGATGSLGANKDIVVAAAPQIVAVTSPTAPGTYYPGDTVTIRVQFDKPVTVNSIPSPTLLLNTLVSRTAVYASNFAADTLDFDYLVAPGDSTGGAPLNYVATTSLTPGGGINLVWTGPATPGSLPATLTLPATAALNNILPTLPIIIAPDLTAPSAPGIALTADIGVNSGDGFTTYVAPNNVTVTINAGDTTQIASQPVTWQAFNGITPITPAVPLGVGVTSVQFTLVPGVYAAGTIRVVLTDASGNPSLAGTNAIQWVIDNVPPADLAVTGPTDTGVPGDGVTSDATLNVTGLEVAALPFTVPGTLQLSVDGGTTWISAASGVSTIAIPNDGTYPTGSIRVRQMDQSGNYSVLSTIVNPAGPITIDRTVATLGLGPIVDTGASPSDGITNNGTITVTSGLEPTARVQVSVTGSGGPFSIQAIADGATTVTLPLDGTYAPGTVWVRQVDRAGNVGAATPWNPTTTVVLDRTIATLAATIADSNIVGDNITNDYTVSVSNLETNAFVEISEDDGNSWVPAAPNQTVVDIPSDGTFPTGFVRVRQTDLAGNVSVEEIVDLNRSANPLILKRTIAVPTLPATTGGDDFREYVVTFSATDLAALPVINSTVTIRVEGTVRYVGPAAAEIPIRLANKKYAAGLIVVEHVDVAGNLVTRSNTSVVNSGIFAFSPDFPSTAVRTMRAPVISLPIKFNRPVTNVTISSLKLLWNNRTLNLAGATLTQTGQRTYLLTLPKALTNRVGTYTVIVNGTLTGIRSGSAEMTGRSLIHWYRAP